MEMEKKANSVKKETSWGGVAEWYDELLESSPDSFQAKVILPNVTRILDLKPGMKVIDVACGQGFFSRVFEQQGASVSGSDISSELINAAIKKSPKSIDYHVNPADALTFATAAIYDA